MSASLGVPLAQNKAEGPVTENTFLGIVIDLACMECPLLEEKVQDLLLAVHRVRGARKVRLRELQSLLGKLNFACRFIPMGRVFLLMATAGITLPLPVSIER